MGCKFGRREREISTHIGDVKLVEKAAISRQEDYKTSCSFPDDYKSELREQLPLIAGSAAAGVVFIVSLVAISIVCSRYNLLNCIIRASFSFQKVDIFFSGEDYALV